MGVHLDSGMGVLLDLGMDVLLNAGTTFSAVAGSRGAKAFVLRDEALLTPTRRLRQLCDRRARPCDVVLQKSTPAQNRQRIYILVINSFFKSQLPHKSVYIGKSKGQVDGFVRELTFVKQRYEHFL